MQGSVIAISLAIAPLRPGGLLRFTTKLHVGKHVQVSLFLREDAEELFRTQLGPERQHAGSHTQLCLNLGLRVQPAPRVVGEEAFFLI